MDTTQSSRSGVDNSTLTVANRNKFSDNPCLKSALILFSIVLIEFIIAFETRCIPFGHDALNMEGGREILKYLRNTSNEWDWVNPIEGGNVSRVLLSLSIFLVIATAMRWHLLSTLGAISTIVCNEFQLVCFFAHKLDFIPLLYVLLVIMSIYTLVFSSVLLHKLLTKYIRHDKRTTAIILAFPWLLGAFGLHRFYLKQSLWGFFYLLCLLSPLWPVPIILATVDFVKLLRMSNESFDVKYPIRNTNSASAYQNSSVHNVSSDHES